MNNLKIKIQKPHQTPAQLANQFSQGMYGLTLSELARRIVKEIQEQKTESQYGGDPN